MQDEIENAYIVRTIEDFSLHVPFLEATWAGSQLYGAPDFSVFDLFSPNENTLSRVLADLLNPYGMHGQEGLFLNALLSILRLPLYDRRDFVTVGCEISTQSYRRMDIVIKSTRFIICIENKPWAIQQQNQLADYMDEIDRIAGQQQETRLVFLSEQRPETARDRAERITFKDNGEGTPSLSEILKGTLDRIKADRIRHFVADFIGYIEKSFGGKAMTSIKSLYINAIDNEYDIRDAAWRKAIVGVCIAQDAVHAKIIDEIGSYILKTIKELYSDEFHLVSFEYTSATYQKGDFSLGEAIKTNRMVWGFYRHGWVKNCVVGLITEGGEARPFQAIEYGVWAPKPELEAGWETCEKHDEISRSLKNFPGGRRTAKWPWYRTCSLPCWNAEAILSLVLESPTARACDHPKVQTIANDLIALIRAVDDTLGKTG